MREDKALDQISEMLVFDLIDSSIKVLYHPCDCTLQFGFIKSDKQTRENLKIRMMDKHFEVIEMNDTDFGD